MFFFTVRLPDEIRRVAPHLARNMPEPPGS